MWCLLRPDPGAESWHGDSWARCGVGPPRSDARSGFAVLVHELTAFRPRLAPCCVLYRHAFLYFLLAVSCCSLFCSSLPGIFLYVLVPTHHLRGTLIQPR